MKQFCIWKCWILDYHLHKINFKRGKSNEISPKWLKSTKATINPQNKNDNRCFQYAITVALNHQNIGKYLERISNIKHFINRDTLKGIDFPAHHKEDDEKLEKNYMEIDWKKFEQNNKAIALNILFVPHNTKTIRLPYKSKYNHKCENQVVLLMINDVKKWHYVALKSVLIVL